MPGMHEHWRLPINLKGRCARRHRICERTIRPTEPHFDIARHHRDEVIPLRKLISEENQLRYNGMIIGVFELLADARDQINTVMAAINAEQFLAGGRGTSSLTDQPPHQRPLSAASPASKAAPKPTEQQVQAMTSRRVFQVCRHRWRSC